MELISCAGTRRAANPKRAKENPVFVFTALLLLAILWRPAHSSWSEMPFSRQHIRSSAPDSFVPASNLPRKEHCWDTIRGAMMTFGAG